jgi:small-conductance mechanosensitive channel
MPEFLTAGTVLDMEIWQWLGLALLVVGAIVLGRLGESLGLALAHSFTRLTRVQEDDELVDAGRNSLRLPLIAGLLVFGSSFLLLPASVQDAVDLVARSMAIVALAWFSIRFVNKGADLIERRLNAGQNDDPYRSRGLETQITVLRRLLVVAAYVVAGALLLLQFQAVRSLGLSLLASAGVAGLVIGFAAQKSLSTVLAGIQISLSQPIRIGDKVIVETEFGTIEEIRLTYVVVLLWDLRRMVLPITYFLEKPFQNWSKNGTQLLGAVMLQVDYLADVDAFRTEVQRILKNEARTLWDGAVQGVQVVDTNERMQTLRILTSARDAATAFDLRCIVRESLVRFLRANPQWIPSQRTLPVEKLAEKAVDEIAHSVPAPKPALSGR